MKSRGSTYILSNKFAWIAVGYSLTQFAVGFRFSRYSIDIDLFFVWLSVEF